MIDDIVAIINIFSISACAALAVTWAPLAAKVIWSRRSTMLGLIGVGLVWVAITTGAVRQYSFAMREMDMMWLRDSYIAPILLMAQSIGLVLLALSYYLPRESGRIAPVRNYNGLWAFGIVFAVMLAIKVVF